MKFEKIEEKVKTYRWLKDIADRYRVMIDLIEREKDYFKVEKIEYSARSDTQVLDLNMHRTLPPQYIVAGLKDALQGIEKEIKEIKEDLMILGIEV